MIVIVINKPIFNEIVLQIKLHCATILQPAGNSLLWIWCENSSRKSGGDIGSYGIFWKRN